MSPIQMATRDKNGGKKRPRPAYPPVDVLFALEKCIGPEIVVDWQLPSDTDRERR